MGALEGDLRAFAAAARKELRVLRRYPTLLFGTFFWPIMLPAVWVYMGRAFSGSDPRALEAFTQRSGTSEVAGFIFVGFSMYMWLSILLWGPGTSLRQEQLRGSLEALFLTPASRLVILFGPPSAHLYTVLIQFAIMGAALWLLFGVPLALGAIAGALVVIGLAVPAMYATGSLFASSVLRFGEVGPIVQLVRGTFVLACGITFPIALLPLWAQTVAIALPPTHVVSSLRDVLLAERSVLGVADRLVVLLAMAAVVGALAVLVFSAMERAAKRSGMLGRF